MDQVKVSVVLVKSRIDHRDRNAVSRGGDPTDCATPYRRSLHVEWVQGLKSATVDSIVLDTVLSRGPIDGDVADVRILSQAHGGGLGDVKHGRGNHLEVFDSLGADGMSELIALHVQICELNDDAHELVRLGLRAVLQQWM